MSELQEINNYTMPSSTINWHDENLFSLSMVTLLIVSSLTIVGYFFHIDLLFTIAGIACSILVLMCITAALLTTRPQERISTLLYFAMLLPILLIGYFIVRDILSGIALGMGFSGVLLALYSCISNKVRLETAKWLEKEFGDDDKGKRDEMTPIILDENVTYEPDRVKAMHTAYARISGIYASIEKEVNLLNANKETIQALMKYEASGLREKDLDADNSGTIYVPDRYLDVLEDDSINNLVNKAKGLQSQFSDTIRFYL